MASLIYNQEGEIKASGIELRSSFDDYNADEVTAIYDENGNDVRDEEVHQELNLDGLIGFKQVDNKSIKVKFDTGEIYKVSVNPNKMSNILEHLRSRAFRHSNKALKCY